MGIRPFQKIQTTDKELNLLQSYLKDTLDALTSNPFNDVKVVKQVSLASGSNQIHHGLGRNYYSWGWLRPSASVTLYEMASPDPTKFIVIVSSAPATVDLFVF